MLRRKARVIHFYLRDFDLLQLGGVEVKLSAEHSRQFEKMAALSAGGRGWSWWKRNWQTVRDNCSWVLTKNQHEHEQLESRIKAHSRIFSENSPKSGNHEPTSPSNINQITYFSLDAHRPHPFNPQTITNHRSLRAHIRNNFIPAPFNTPITRTLHKTCLPINYFYVSCSKSYP